MHAQRRKKFRGTLVSLFRQLDGAIVCARPSSAADQEDGLDPRLFCAREYGLAVNIELVALEMGMTIYVHGLGL
jgi:hypothetical protein